MPLYRHLAASATTDTTNASNISAGTLAAARGGAGAITGALKGNGSGVVSQAAASDFSNGTTGSGNIVLATSPTLTTPTLGVASGTSLALSENAASGPIFNLSGAGHVTVAGNSNTALSIGLYGLLIIADDTQYGGIGLYLYGNNITYYLGDNAEFVAPTTTPSNVVSFDYDGTGAYRIYNGFSTSISFRVVVLSIA